MTDHSLISACPDCGTPLPPDSPQALCPACLMRQALASRTIVEGDPKADISPPLSPEEIADKFPGFEILECLGRGGMGVVYKARQKSLNRIIAVKILAPERGGETRFAERFAREAEFLAKLNHPHIVTIHDFGETAGLFYLVMEFVDGVNLRDLLRDGKLEAKQALAIVPPICDALQYAHDKGIVHRDIKPENLLLDRDGRIKIADFGISALMGTDGDPSGTPPYMAPEQCGASPEVDNRADIYALGVVLYEMLTGERPNKELIAPSKKVHIDVRLDEIVLRALERTPELRFQTAGEFRTQVETIASTSGNFGAKEAKIHTSKIDNHPSDVSSRFSRSAIVGACWALAAVLHYLVPTLGYRMKSEFVPIMMSILGLSAPFGTTILGWIGVTQIRRSAGKLCGLGLAMFDGLLFPLLVLTGLIGWFWGWVFKDIMQAYLTAGEPQLSTLEQLLVTNINGLTLMATLGTALVVSLLIIRRIWRAVSQPPAISQNPEQPKPAPSQTSASGAKPNRLGKWAVGFFIGAIAGAPLLWGFMGAQEVMVFCGLALLLSLVLGLMSWRSNPGKFAALASGLSLSLLLAFTFNYLTPRPPAIKAALESERVKFSFSHTEALTGGHELTLPATTRMRWFPNTGQPLSLTNNRQVLTRVRLLEKHHANVFAEAACSVDGTNWESQILPLSADVTKGNLSFQNGTEVTVELLGAGTAGSNRPPSTAFGPVVERELILGEKEVLRGLYLTSGNLTTLTEDEYSRGLVEIEGGRKLGPTPRDWFDSKQLDIAIFERGHDFRISGREGRFELNALPAEKWDTATYRDVSDAVALETTTKARSKRQSALTLVSHDMGWAFLRIPPDAELPLTYAMKSGNKLGLLQITARVQNPDGIRLRYKLVQNEVVDQIVPSIYGRELGDLKCFDFESNRFHSPPKELADELLTAVNREQARKEVWHRVNPELLEWLEKAGVDVVAAAYDSGAELLFIDQSDAGEVALPLKGSLEEIDPSQAPLKLVNRGLPKNVMNLTRTAYLGWPREPRNEFFPFQTREGNRGVLQVTGISDDPGRGVKIRYKLVHNAPPVKPAPKKQYELSIQFGQNPNDPIIKKEVELGIPFNDFKKAGDRLFSISGQIDEPKNGKFPGSITLGDYNVSEAYKGTGHQGTIPVELELGKPFNHTVIVGIGFIRIITLNEKPASSESSDGEPATSETDAGEGTWGDHFKNGEIHRAQNKLEDSLASYRLSLAGVQAEMKRRSQDAAWQTVGQRRNKQSLTRIGDVLCAQGDHAGALENYRAAMASIEPLVRKVPTDEAQRNELAALYVKIGDVLEATGDRAGALAAFRKAQEVDFPNFQTWEETFKSIGGDYNPATAFKPDELRQLAANPKSHGDFRRLMWLINRAGAEKDAGFRYLLDKPELRKNEEVNLALIGYDYSVNGNPKALDELLAKLAMEKVGSDSSAVVALSFVDEWDRVPKVVKAHFSEADGAGGTSQASYKLRSAYYFPRNSLEHEGKAGEGAPVNLLDRIASFPRGFGPVVERLVPRLAAGKACLLDFETGEFRTPPDDLVEKMKRNGTEKAELTKSSLRWLRESGVDVAASPDSDTLWFLGVIANTYWGKGARPFRFDDLTPEIVIDVLSGPLIKPERNPGIYSAIVPAGAGAMVFITSQGNMGVLEIPGGINDPAGVKIRYKLLRGVKPSAEAMAAAKVVWDLPPLEPVKELRIPQQDFPEGAGRIGYRFTVSPGEGDYVLATVREYEGSETVGEKTPVKRQAARLLRTPSETHSEDVFLDSHRVERPIREGEADGFALSGFGQQVAITGLEYAGGFGLAGSFGISGQDLSPGLATRRFKFTDTGGDKSRTRIVEFELQVIDSDEAAVLAKRHGISLPDENVANWAITLSAPLETTKPEIENDPRAGGR